MGFLIDTLGVESSYYCIQSVHPSIQFNCSWLDLKKFPIWICYRWYIGGLTSPHFSILSSFLSCAKSNCVIQLSFTNFLLSNTGKHEI